jgi:hypothetical protein
MKSMNNHNPWKAFLLAVLVQGLMPKALALTNVRSPKEEFMRCRHEMMQTFSVVEKGYRECQREKFYTEGPPDVARKCFPKCLLRKIDILEADDGVSLQAFEKGIEGKFTGSSSERLRETFKDCLEKHGALVNPTDPLCPGYGEIMYCLEKTIMKLCEDPNALPEEDDDDEEEEVAEPPKSEYDKCSEEKTQGLMSVMKNFEVCKSEKSYIELYKSEDTRYFAQRCFAKCILRQEKALDASGHLTPESFESALTNRVSGRAHGIALKAFKDCYDEHKALLNPEDPTCPGFDKIGICLQGGLQKICDPPEVLTMEQEAARAKEEL